MDLKNMDAMIVIFDWKIKEAKLKAAGCGRENELIR